MFVVLVTNSMELGNFLLVSNQHQNRAPAQNKYTWLDLVSWTWTAKYLLLLLLLLRLLLLIPFTGAIWEFLTLSSLRCEPSPTRILKWPRHNRVQITCNTSSAGHMQHVVLCATWQERTVKLLSLTELKLHLFELYFIGWTINRLRRGGNWSTHRKPPRRASENATY